MIIDKFSLDDVEEYRNIIINDDSLKVMGSMPDDIIQSTITSPPFWNLRNYADLEGLGAEEYYEDYIQHLTEFGREIHRITKKNGTLWLHMGDTYAGGCMTGKSGPKSTMPDILKRYGKLPIRKIPDGMKKKDLIGIPYLVASAFRDVGWYFRRAIVLKMKNFTPEPQVKDRPVKSHYHMLYFSKGYSSYYKKYDAADRDVWDIPTVRVSYKHPAAYSEELVRQCLLRTTKENDLILDPFGGIGTTGIVCKRFNRKSVTIEIVEEFCKKGEERLNVLE